MAVTNGIVSVSDPTFRLLRNSIEAVWRVIADEEIAGSPELENRIAIEHCTQLERMSAHDPKLGRDAYGVLRELYAAFGRGNVLQLLDEKIRLVEPVNGEGV